MFYTTFEALCKDRKVAPSAVARRLGMSSSAPGRWKGGSAPDLLTAEKLADFFGVSIDYLVKGDHAPTTSSTINGARNSTILQGNIGHTISAGDVTQEAPRLTEQEEEMLRLFRGFDMRKKTAVLSYLYELEDGGKREG